MDNIDFVYKSRAAQLQALNSANGPLVFVGKARSPSCSPCRKKGKKKKNSWNESSINIKT
jgi:hypothetical protein